ncbi:MAG: actin family protein [Crenarchaeota archaeon]|nr:actin family protein [Thermoproteota archaeon]MCR8453834.1 actin family protein [Thermoproteota archaeon]MCR8455347.1 actin family protein [Thermoproteota archaeon]MCR8462617.1 actin family protein [Thermoproteota archaeon]MCR8470926.1 actin family protein [Thermoproteota archaeon]
MSSASHKLPELERPAVVADLGTGFTKAGFAGDDTPRTVFPTVVGYPKYTVVMPEAETLEYYVGRDAIHMRGVLQLVWPLEHAIVTDWDAWEKLMYHLYYKELRTNPQDQALLVTEAPLSPKENRIRMAEVLFETFGVPALYVATQAILSLYAAGRVTGLVVDSGDGVTHIVPVQESYLLAHAVRRLNLAGRDVTRYLAKLLTKRGIYFTSSAEMEIARDIKEKLCYLAVDYKAELEKAKKIPKAVAATYELPDGRVIELVEERFQSPEIMYSPMLIGLEAKPLDELVLDSIFACDIDVRPSMYSNIVVSGGNTMIPNFAQRLEKELKEIVPEKARDKVAVEAPEERIYGVFIGGSILASIPAFKKIVVTRKEWSEVGPDSILRTL